MVTDTPEVHVTGGEAEEASRDHKQMTEHRDPERRKQRGDEEHRRRREKKESEKKDRQPKKGDKKKPKRQSSTERKRVKEGMDSEEISDWLKDKTARDPNDPEALLMSETNWQAHSRKEDEEIENPKPRGKMVTKTTFVVSKHKHEKHERKRFALFPEVNRQKLAQAANLRSPDNSRGLFPEFGRDEEDEDYAEDDEDPPPQQHHRERRRQEPGRKERAKPIYPNYTDPQDAKPRPKKRTEEYTEVQDAIGQDEGFRGYVDPEEHGQHQQQPEVVQDNPQDYPAEEHRRKKHEKRKERKPHPKEPEQSAVVKEGVVNFNQWVQQPPDTDPEQAKKDLSKGRRHKKEKAGDFRDYEGGGVLFTKREKKEKSSTKRERPPTGYDWPEGEQSPEDGQLYYPDEYPEKPGLLQGILAKILPKQRGNEMTYQEIPPAWDPKVAREQEPRRKTSSRERPPNVPQEEEKPQLQRRSTFTMYEDNGAPPQEAAPPPPENPEQYRPRTPPPVPPVDERRQTIMNEKEMAGASYPPAASHDRQLESHPDPGPAREESGQQPRGERNPRDNRRRKKGGAAGPDARPSRDLSREHVLNRSNSVERRPGQKKEREVKAPPTRGQRDRSREHMLSRKHSFERKPREPRDRSREMLEERGRKEFDDHRDKHHVTRRPSPVKKPGRSRSDEKEPRRPAEGVKARERRNRSREALEYRDPRGALPGLPGQGQPAADMRNKHQKHRAPTGGPQARKQTKKPGRH